MNLGSRIRRIGASVVGVVLLSGLLVTGCGSYKEGEAADESASIVRRLNELERKQDTQNARFNQMMYGIEDSLNVWRESATGGMTKAGRYDVLIRDEVYFDLNEYRLDDGDKTILDEFAMRLAEHPGAYLQISGYADQTGGDYYNLQLSQQRAEAAVRYLTRQWDVPLNRIERLGFGEEDQAYPQDASAGSNRNRRIEIQLRVPVEGKTKESLP